MAISPFPPHRDIWKPMGVEPMAGESWRRLRPGGHPEGHPCYCSVEQREQQPLPTISRFYGILIRMYYNDHHPPHFHAVYGEHEVVIGIEDLAILRGELPSRALALATEWARIHRAELQDEWARAGQRRPLLPISPLE